MGYGKLEEKLHKACLSGRASKARWCLRRGAGVDEVDAWGKAAIHKAALRGAQGCVKALLAAGADPNIADRLGKAALNMAAREGHRGCVEILMPVADLCARDQAGESAYLAGSKFCHGNAGDPFEWVLLLGEAMGPGLSDADRLAAMESAAGHGHVGMLMALMRPMASDVSYRRARRRSLMAAAEGGWLDCVRILMDEADFDVGGLDPRDTWARRAQVGAERWGHGDVAGALEDFGRVVAERRELERELAYDSSRGGAATPEPPRARGVRRI